VLQTSDGMSRRRDTQTSEVDLEELDEISLSDEDILVDSPAPASEQIPKASPTSSAYALIPRHAKLAASAERVPDALPSDFADDLDAVLEQRLSPNSRSDQQSGEYRREMNSEDITSEQPALELSSINASSLSPEPASALARAGSELGSAPKTSPLDTISLRPTAYDGVGLDEMLVALDNSPANPSSDPPSVRSGGVGLSWDYLRRSNPPPLRIRLRALVEVLLALGAVHTDLLRAPNKRFHGAIWYGNLLFRSDGAVLLVADEIVTPQPAVYAAPEQREQRADQQADCYSVGVLLLEAITAQTLSASEVSALGETDCTTHPFWSRFVADPLLEVAVRATSRDPWRRWPTARDFAEALLSCASDRVASRSELAGLVQSCLAEQADRATPVQPTRVSGFNVAKAVEPSPLRAPVAGFELPLPAPVVLPLAATPTVLSAPVRGAGPGRPESSSRTPLPTNSDVQALKPRSRGTSVVLWSVCALLAGGAAAFAARAVLFPNPLSPRPALETRANELVPSVPSAAPALPAASERTRTSPAALPAHPSAPPKLTAPAPANSTPSSAASTRQTSPAPASAPPVAHTHKPQSQPSTGNNPGNKTTKGGAKAPPSVLTEAEALERRL
jgi:hypothetical protein